MHPTVASGDRYQLRYSPFELYPVKTDTLTKVGRVYLLAPQAALIHTPVVQVGHRTSGPRTRKI